MRCSQCSFDNPEGFAFCGRCGARLEVNRNQLTAAELDHLHQYLPASLVEELRFDRSAPSSRLLEESSAHLARLLEITTRHLPAYVIEEVWRNPTPGATAGRFVPGTLLFADISGFTAMSERLSRIGQEGAEEVTHIVNCYFEAMLTLLRDYGGHLVKFGGDALLGLFLESEGQSTARAAHAAMEMQAAMSSFAQTRTSQGVFPLQMKISLRYGRFYTAQLGTAQAMEQTLFGSDVNAVAALANHALAGQVLLDQVTLDALRVPRLAFPLTDDTYVLDHVELTDRSGAATTQTLPMLSGSPLERLQTYTRLLDAFTVYLPAGLLGRLSNLTRAHTLPSEHRLVAVLFANLHHFGEIADRLGVGQEARIAAILNRRFVALQSAIHDFGGVVNKIDLYDHGDKLLAFFGAPVTHENDAERGVRAAAAMLKNAATTEEADAPALRVQLGISAGFVFAGYVGTTWRNEYTVMGDEVNLAARLMTTAAEGQIIVSTNVRRKVTALFQFEPQGEVMLKGKSAPVPIYALTGERAIPEPVRGLAGLRAPLIGRDAEWQRMLASLEALLLGRGQIMRIVGEAGVGKSRLADELRQRFMSLRTAGHGGPSFLQRTGSIAHWVTGHCVSYTDTLSYAPFLEIVRDLFRLQATDSDDEALIKLRQTLNLLLAPEDASVTLPYLARFLDLPLEAELAEKVRHLEAEALQKRIFVALRTLLEGCAPPDQLDPLVIVLEDIHWIDAASADLLDYLLPLVNRLPVLFVLLYRPDRDRASWRIHEKVTRDFLHCAVDVELRNLSRVESEQLLQQLVPLAQWPVDLQALVLERAEGNPLYVEEVLRGLIEDGWLIHADSGEWRVAQHPSIWKVPETLQGVLMARLDRLTQPAREAAQAAAVVGRSVPFDQLATLWPEEDTHLNDHLIQLQQSEILHEARRIPVLTYTFTHVLAQEIIYNSLSAELRREYHRRIASYLEARAAEIDQDAAQIAHHASAGQDWPRALKYHLLAGQEAQRLFANQTAIEHFTQALHSAQHLRSDQTPVERQLIHAELGALLTTTGKYGQAQPHLEQARQLARERSDEVAEARACRWLARLYELQGEYPQAFVWIEHGLRVLGEREVAEMAELRLIAGLIYNRQGQFDWAREQAQAARQLAEQIADLAVLARANNLLGLMQLRQDSVAALAYFQTALQLYERVGHLQGQALSHNWLGNATLALGRLAEAEKFYLRARAAFEQIGDVYNQVIIDNNLGEIALKRGAIDDALNFYQAALQSLTQIGGSAWILGMLHNNLGTAYLRRSEIVTAREHLRVARQCYERAQIREPLPELYRHLVEAAYLDGDFTQAEAEGQHALQLARELTNRNEEGIILQVLGKVANAQRRSPEAEAQLNDSLKILGEAGDEYELARSRLALAELYSSQNKVAEARTLAGQALAAFERLEAELDADSTRKLVESLPSH